MKVSSKVKINMSRVNQLCSAQITALEKTAEELHTRVAQAQVVPRDAGALQGEYFFADYSESPNGRAQLVHDRPYARRLYFHPEYNFNTSENPNARGEWYQPWIDGNEKDFCKKAFKEFYKKEGGV